MSESYSYTRVRSPQLRHHWSPVLKTWAEKVISFTDERDSEDFLCWYNERSSLSSLAGAFWLNDHYAIEEMSTAKQSKKKGDWTGRCDLWVTCGNSDYWIEAKQVWASASPRASSAVADAIKGINLAREDAKSHVIDKEDVDAMGVVFMAFYLPKSHANERKELQEGFISKVLEAVEYDFAAVACPSSDEIISTSGRHYCGCLLLGRRVKSGKVPNAS